MRGGMEERGEMEVRDSVIVWVYVPVSDATPTFVHDGHEVECREAYVLSHTWLPSRHSPGKLSSGVMTSTMLSADSEGSLHAWQWKPPDPTHPS